MTAILSLYCDAPPSGRCLHLAKAIADISSLSGKESLLVATGLFNSHYKMGNPARVPIKTGADTTELLKLCSDYGILTAGEVR